VLGGANLLHLFGQLADKLLGSIHDHRGLVRKIVHEDVHLHPGGVANHEGVVSYTDRGEFEPRTVEGVIELHDPLPF